MRRTRKDPNPSLAGSATIKSIRRKAVVQAMLGVQ
jgi:hypothetical protein